MSLTTKTQENKMAIDKRILKTRERIQNAFMTLTLEKETSKITVSDLSDKASINRSTFYLHYKDPGEVGKEIDGRISRAISSLMTTFNLDDIYGSSYTIFSGLTEQLDNNELMKNYIIYSKNSATVIASIKLLLADTITAAITAKGKEPTDYLVTFIASGIMDCYISWCRSDVKIPLGQLIGQFASITARLIENLV